jgi:hypothetical protein
MELPKFDGFVGYNFFERHIVCVDFPGNRLIIDRAERAALQGVQNRPAAASPGPASEQQ